MRLLVLSSLLCILLLCFSIFSTEGKRHRRPPARPLKSRPCCSQVSGAVPATRRGRRMKTCKPCKSKSDAPFWVVPGALPEV